tara:strand:- start:707 stop:919 length:213 start_codon:yes stop_codon:yes gene_type:complete
MVKIGRELLIAICITKKGKMLKRLLSSIYNIFSNKYENELIESYLSKSSNTYDLDNRIRELEKKGKYYNW